jgi:hypothetical protein
VTWMRGWCVGTWRSVPLMYHRLWPGAWPLRRRASRPRGLTRHTCVTPKTHQHLKPGPRTQLEDEVAPFGREPSSV